MFSSQLSTTGLLGATVTAVVTTLDDAIWLVPFVGSSSSMWSSSARIVHAVIFVLTLVSLAVASVVVALLIQSTVSTTYSDSNTIEEALSSNKQQEILIGSIAAVLCWVLAFAFFVKKFLKRRRRRQQQQQQLEREETSQLVQQNKVEESTTPPDYNATSVVATSSTYNREGGRPTDARQSRAFSCGNIGTVISLTALGALDEVSYFPALILGKIFTPLELCLGILLAACIILIIVTCCLARCKPLVDCLDQIPIYAVIAMFATILTLGVLYDAFWDQE